jgi:hypothetical protein
MDQTARISLHHSKYVKEQAATDNPSRHLPRRNKLPEPLNHRTAEETPAVGGDARYESWAGCASEKRRTVTVFFRPIRDAGAAASRRRADPPIDRRHPHP